VSDNELIRAEAADFPITVLCGLLGVSTSGYYAWKRRPPSARQRTDERVATKLRAIHTTTRGVYGTRRMRAELDEPVGRRRLSRLMRENGLQPRIRRRFKVTTDSAHGQGYAPDLIQRDFTAERPNQRWVGDITYLWTGAGWCYLAVIVDLYARRVVGWALDEHMRTDLVLRALHVAIERRQPGHGELTFHSDRGAQYAAARFRQALREHGIAASMGRTGDCFDNAVAESFFATLKKECIHQVTLATRTEAFDETERFVDGFYNPVRRHSANGYLSPIDAERRFQIRSQLLAS